MSVSPTNQLSSPCAYMHGQQKYAFLRAHTHAPSCVFLSLATMQIHPPHQSAIFKRVHFRPHDAKPLKIYLTLLFPNETPNEGDLPFGC